MKTFKIILITLFLLELSSFAGRMYDANVQGRFIQRDPLGQVDGASLYQVWADESFKEIRVELKEVLDIATDAAEKEAKIKKTVSVIAMLENFVVASRDGTFKAKATKVKEYYVKTLKLDTKDLPEYLKSLYEDYVGAAAIATGAAAAPGPLSAAASVSAEEPPPVSVN